MYQVLKEKKKRQCIFFGKMGIQFRKCLRILLHHVERELER